MTKKKARTPTPIGSEILDPLRRLIAFTNEFCNIKRTIWIKGRKKHEPERDGEHTYQVLMFAWFLNEYLALGFPFGLLAKLGLVHDAPEKDGGETACFFRKDAPMQSLHRHSTKKQREAEAIKNLEREWSRDFPDFITHLHRYEKRAYRAEKFMYAIDKLLGILNDERDGWRTAWFLKTSLKKIHAYKSPRIRTDKVIAAIYDHLYAEMKKDPFFVNKDWKKKRRVTRSPQ